MSKALFSCHHLSKLRNFERHKRPDGEWYSIYYRASQPHIIQCTRLALESLGCWCCQITGFICIHFTCYRCELIDDQTFNPKTKSVRNSLKTMWILPTYAAQLSILSVFPLPPFPTHMYFVVEFWCVSAKLMLAMSTVVRYLMTFTLLSLVLF